MKRLFYQCRCHQAPRMGRQAWPRLVAIAALGLILGTQAPASGAQRAAVPAPPPAPPATHEFQFVKSAFVTSPGFGKDPFFPRSTRILGAVASNPVESAVPVSSLVLKGISGPRTHRLAIINNRTFETGEEGEIKVAGQSMRLRCVKIADDGVTVSINGQTQKLVLGPK